MTDSPITLRIEPDLVPTQSALSAYLAEDAAKSRRRLPGPEAEKAIKVFGDGLRNLTERCDSFLSGSDRQVSHLALGKVQSGKTAHLLGTLAWAADSSVLAAVVFTGITGSLNDQTHTRLQSDLEALPGAPVTVLLVPTLKQEDKYSTFVSELQALVLSRKRLGPSQPLPVLVTMKNSARVDAAKQAFRDVLGPIGADTTLLAIDDEADQASQNAKARKREVAATYSSLSGIRELNLRNIWISYTATPQAVLLAEKAGKIRPDYVVTVPPRMGYFGLEHATSNAFEHQRVEVSDFRTSARALTSTPESLVTAIWRFLFVAWVRKSFPASFYSDSLITVRSDQRMLSTQMLIHESSMKLDHGRMFQLVQDECNNLEDLVETVVDGTASSGMKALLFDGFEEVARRLEECGTDALELFREFTSPEGQIAFLELLRDVKIMVINSDGTSPTAGEPRPVDDEDYERHRAWILIGGDILGRGITIPQLTVSYFLRSSKKPNFDTVLQQLRFCGYRQDYSKWLSIHAPALSFTDLEYMNTVDIAVWNRALTWDKNEMRLTGTTMPRVFYAASKGARFDPTRISVRDPDLADRTIEKGSIFGLREIFDPRDLRSNLATLRSWHAETQLVESASDGKWIRFDDIAPHALGRLLVSWNGSKKEEQTLEAVSELFDPALGELGLSETPTVTYISKLLTETWDTPEDLVARVADVDVTRTVRKGAAGSTWAGWLERFNQRLFLPEDKRPTLAVPHVGGGQRALRDRIPYDAVVLVIEPILGLETSRSRASAVSVGIGFAAMSPESFEIRTIGHS